MNWKELNPDVNRICAEYCGGLKERSKKENWRFILLSYWVVCVYSMKFWFV